jgi:hypothetical protein
MTLRMASTIDIAGAVVVGAAGFALGYLTPVIGGILVLSLILLALDAALGAAGEGPGTQIVHGLGKLAALSWSPIDASASSAGRVWLWRAPAIAALAGFLLAWAQSLVKGNA